MTPASPVVPLLSVSELTTTYPTPVGEFRAVDQVSFEVQPSERLAIVGESGSGKSQTVLSVLGLVQKPGRVAGTARFRGRDLLQLSRRELRRVRGGEIAMIFQDPMTSWNPVLRVGTQIEEAILLHRNLGSTERARRVRHLLEQVGIADPAERASNYPHQLSGGMRQRGMIAMALANDPALLIADEPTTALDVTIQAQVLDMLRRAQAETGAATIFITHDLGVVAELAERVIVMYAGRIMESGSVRTIFTTPRHPYTAGLLNSLPSLKHDTETLTPIPGSPPNLLVPTPGCPFQPRCEIGRDREICTTTRPPLVEVASGHESACHFAAEVLTR
jgi:oligopeptide/dipeptide ABC transporter ATP-binding protein